MMAPVAPVRHSRSHIRTPHVATREAVVVYRAHMDLYTLGMLIIVFNFFNSHDTHGQVKQSTLLLIIGGAKVETPR